MRKHAGRLIRFIERFADRGWYELAVGVCAALDAFVYFIPIEVLMVPGVLLRPRRWLYAALVVTTGSALGAGALAEVASTHGEAWIARLSGQAHHSKAWEDVIRFFNDHGLWTIPIIAVSPFPQQPAVALAGLAHLSLPLIVGGVWLGRAVKYVAVAWTATHVSSVTERWRKKFFD